MIPFEDLKIFLPKYLSPDSDENLFKALKEFPKNIDDRLYTSYHQDDPVVFQGDGFKDFLVINFPDPKIDPYNYTERDIFDKQISKRLLKNYIKHLEDINKISLI